jgi:hypothetical protein
MSGNVEKASQSLTVATICPIVLNTAEQIITYKTASTIALQRNAGSGLGICYPTLWAYDQVYTEAQAPKCCDYGIKQSLQSNTPIYY